MTNELPAALVERVAEAIVEEKKRIAAKVMGCTIDELEDVGAKEQAYLESEAGLSALPIMEMVEALKFYSNQEKELVRKSSFEQYEPSEYKQNGMDNGEKARAVLAQLPEDLR